MTPKPVSSADYEFLREFLRREMGHELGDGKEYLVESRLNPIAASFELDDLPGLVARLRVNADRLLRDAVVEAMSIQETSFFRSGKTFELVRADMIPALMRSRASTSRLRVWCAACSTGQEPFSVAMTIDDHFPKLWDWQVEIVATDISRQALDRAAAGAYNQFEVQRGLPVQTLLKHFRQVEDRWLIADQIRRRVKFQQFNLLDPFVGLGDPFDVIFLRSVLIYFDVATKSAIFTKLRRAIANDGFLVLGEAESIIGLTDQFSIPNGEAGYYVPTRR